MVKVLDRSPNLPHLGVVQKLGKQNPQLPIKQKQGWFNKAAFVSGTSWDIEPRFYTKSGHLVCMVTGHRADFAEYGPAVFDSNGDFLWARLYDYTDTELLQGEHGGCIIVDSTPTSSYNRLHKINIENGKVVWEKRMHTDANKAYCVLRKSDGAIFGFRYVDTNYKKGWMIDSDGEKVWDNQTLDLGDQLDLQFAYVGEDDTLWFGSRYYYGSDSGNDYSLFYMRIDDTDGQDIAGDGIERRTTPIIMNSRGFHVDADGNGVAGFGRALSSQPSYISYSTDYFGTITTSKQVDPPSGTYQAIWKYNDNWYYASNRGDIAQYNSDITALVSDKNITCPFPLSNSSAVSGYKQGGAYGMLQVGKNYGDYIGWNYPTGDNSGVIMNLDVCDDYENGDYGCFVLEDSGTASSFLGGSGQTAGITINFTTETTVNTANSSASNTLYTTQDFPDRVFNRYFLANSNNEIELQSETMRTKIIDGSAKVIDKSD